MVFSLGIALLMMGYQLITSYLISYKDIFEMFLKLVT
jgi:hypothetical protein